MAGNIWGNMEGKLKNLKISEKMRKAFTIIITGFVIPIAVAVIGFIFININYSKFYHTYYHNMELQMQARLEMKDITEDILWALSAKDSEETKSRIADVSSNMEMFQKTLDELEQDLDTGKTEQLDSIKEKVAETTDTLVKMVEENKRTDAFALFSSDYAGNSDALTEILEQIGEQADHQASSAYQRSVVLGIIINILLVVLGFVSSKFCIRMANILSGSIKKPLKELGQVSHRLSEGNLDIEIDYVSEDEMGVLADDFRETCAKLKHIIQDCGSVLEQMADGNFQVHVKEEEKYVGDFEKLLVSIRRLNHQLSSTLLNINTASDQVAFGSGQMADSAQALAEGATDQAGAVEELTATIENVTKIAEKSAEDALNAAEMVRQSEQDAEKSREEMELLMEAMERITETSHEIENIIGAIEDIASQTNLLSLNASIEAARAGEAGRGFAVVADQIGSLAADSAKSAVTTRELIGKALNEITNGNEITKRTMEVISSVLSSMSGFAEISSASAKASGEQADLLKNVEQGIEQISSVVQSNSASAEETSAVSQELSAEAETLKGMISQFKLREEHASKNTSGN